MAAQSTIKRKRKPGRPRTLDLTVFYVAEIIDWEWDFSFSVRQVMRSADPYEDYRHLNLTCKLLRPSKMAIGDVQLTLMPDEHLNGSSRLKHTPLAVGSINCHRRSFQALFPIPDNVLPSLLVTLGAGRLKYVVMEGERLRYGHGAVRRLSLQRDFDPEDLPPE